MRDRRGDLTFIQNEALRESEAQLAAARDYSRRLLEAQEAERYHMSRRLHDQVGQTLTALKMNLYALQQQFNTAETISAINNNLAVIDEAIDQVRDLSTDLRPLLLDDFGLAVALRWYLDRQAKRCDVAIEFLTSSLNDEERFSPELETACFRIVQEAVTNVVNHAHANRVVVRLERSEPDLVLSISDDGAGFDLNAIHTTLGLRGMEERVVAVGGSLTISSTRERGTEVRARFPAHPEPGRAFAAAVCDVATSSA